MGHGKHNSVRESKVAFDYDDGPLIYSGIGARKTPPDILKTMHLIGERLAGRNWHLRTGGAEGADHAFKEGSESKHTLYLPWDNFNGHSAKGYGFRNMLLDNCGITRINETVDILLRIRPNFHSYSDAVKRLHTRNGLLLTGHNQSPKSKMVICWTPNGEKIGGTGVAISLAEFYRIPVFNLAENTALDRLSQFVQEQEKKYL